MNPVEHATLRNGCRVTIRPAVPGDVPALDLLFRSLSAQDRYRRFHGAVSYEFARRLLEMTVPSNCDHVVFVVVAHGAQGDVLVAEARAAPWGSSQSAEIALTVAPHWRRLGVATLALRCLGRASKRDGLCRLHGSVLPDNAPMLALASAAGPSSVQCFDDGSTVRIEWNPGVESRGALHAFRQLRRRIRHGLGLADRSPSEPRHCFTQAG
jgi:RimJ/RimL family protein N-acetyltransferase